MSRCTAVFFKELKANAEQLTIEQRRSCILSKAVGQFLGGRRLIEPIFWKHPPKMIYRKKLRIFSWKTGLDFLVQ